MENLLTLGNVFKPFPFDKVCAHKLATVRGIVQNSEVARHRKYSSEKL